jgi:hypothetical protein
MHNCISSVLGKRPLLKKCPCTAFYRVMYVVAASITNVCISGKRPCAPKLRVHPWALTWDTTIILVYASPHPPPPQPTLSQLRLWTDSWISGVLGSLIRSLTPSAFGTTLSPPGAWWWEKYWSTSILSQLQQQGRQMKSMGASASRHAYSADLLIILRGGGGRKGIGAGVILPCRCSCSQSEYLNLLLAHVLFDP